MILDILYPKKYHQVCSIFLIMYFWGKCAILSKIVCGGV